MDTAGLFTLLASPESGGTLCHSQSRVGMATEFFDYFVAG
jgi:hypothetical protein